MDIGIFETSYCQNRGVKRKLLSTTNLVPREEDNSRAVILYQPPNLFLPTPGRSLTGSSEGRKGKIVKTYKITSKSKQKCLKTKAVLVTALAATLYVYSNLYQEPIDCSATANSTLIDALFANSSSIFGQELAIEQIITNIKLFLSSKENVEIIIVTGGPGTGKSYLTNLMHRALPDRYYKEKIMFPVSSKELTAANFKPSCDQVRFLFVDDIDSAESWQLGALSSSLKQMKEFPGDHKSFVIINSSAGQKEITKYLFELLENNKVRESITKEDIQNLARNISSPFLDLLNELKLTYSVIPLFPLEKSHVRLCIERELKQKNIPSSTVSVDKVLDLIRFHPAVLEYFAVFGCKNVHSYVNLVFPQSWHF